MSPCVYILESVKNGRYYIGSTVDIEKRIREHNRGKSKYTSDSGSTILVFVQNYFTLQEARKIERWIKSQKSRKLIEEIIKEGYIRKKLHI